MSMFFSLLFSTKHLFFKIKRKSSKIIQKMLVSTFHTTGTAQKMIFFFIKDFYYKCDQTRRELVTGHIS